MKTLLYIFLCCTCTSWAQQTVTANANQIVTWQGKAAIGGYAPIGTLDLEQATLTITQEQLLNLSVVIDMTSLSQENKRLEGHLKEADFFDVEVFTQASFIVTKPINLDSENPVLEGVMTIKGKTQTELIAVQIDRQENQISIGFDHTLDRTAYGIVYNSPSIFKRLKENAIADAFTLKGTLVFAIPN